VSSSPPHACLNHAIVGRNTTRIKSVLDSMDLAPCIDDARGGYTLLANAALWGQEALTRLLLNYSANPGLADSYGRTPLFVASREGHHSVVVDLLKARSLVDPVTSGAARNTPLAIALMRGHSSVVAELVKHGAQINYRYNRSAYTPFMYAVQYGHTLVAAQLIALRADYNAYPTGKAHSYTPLMWAAKLGHAGMTAQLIALRVDVDERDRNGVSALSLVGCKQRDPNCAASKQDIRDLLIKARTEQQSNSDT